MIGRHDELVDVSRPKRGVAFDSWIETPEELALDLSRASLHSLEQSENQLREKATAVLAAASIVVPVAALAAGHGPAGVAVPFGGAAVAYVLCVRECGAALIPHGVRAGLLGGELLEAAKRSGADLDQMQEAAANISTTDTGATMPCSKPQRSESVVQ
jgi:hypothetical protein